MLVEETISVADGTGAEGSMGGGGRVTDAVAWSYLPSAMATAGRLDRVELKVLLPARHEQLLTSALGLDQVREREVRYLDTEDLQLRRHGVLLRARGRRGAAIGGGQLELKWRGCRPPGGAARRFGGRHARIELDAMPALPLWTVTLGPIRPGRAVGGHRRFSRQCTHEQRKLLRRLLGEIPDTLRPFGPSLVRKYGGGTGGLVLESWRLPSGDRVLELSTKCRPQVAARRAGKLRALLAELNVSASPNQVTKTDLTLLAPADH